MKTKTVQLYIVWDFSKWNRALKRADEAVKNLIASQKIVRTRTDARQEK